MGTAVFASKVHKFSKLEGREQELTLSSVNLREVSQWAKTCSLLWLSLCDAGCLRSKVRTIRALKGKYGHAASLQAIPGTLCLCVLLLFCAAPAHSQENGARKVVKKAPVQYPSILKSKGIGGVVRLKVFVKPDGAVRDTEVIGGNPILAESAQSP